MTAVMIYALMRESDGQIRYVGQTTKSLATRLYFHRYAAANGSQLPVHRWIRKHDDVVIVEVLANAVHNADEIVAIAEARQAGARLLNVTAGGDGTVGFKQSETTRAALSASLRGRVITDEWRAKISKRLTGRKLSDETRAKMRQRYARAREQRSVA